MLEQQVTIYRAGSAFSQGRRDVEAFGVADGRFVATGDLADLRDRFPAAPVVDLGGAVVIPGLNDAHAHLADSVQGRLDLDVSPRFAPDIESLIALIARRVNGTEWVLASNYDDSLTGLVHRDQLDAAFPNTPVLVRQASAH